MTLNLTLLQQIGAWLKRHTNTQGHTHSRRHDLRRVEYSTTDYILKYCTMFVADIAVFVLKRDVKLQPTIVRCGRKKVHVRYLIS